MALNYRNFLKISKRLKLRTVCSVNPVRNLRRDKNMGQKAKISNGVKILTVPCLRRDKL